MVLAGANKSQVLKAINSFANTKGLSANIKGKITEQGFKDVVEANLKKLLRRKP